MTFTKSQSLTLPSPAASIALEVQRSGVLFKVEADGHLYPERDASDGMAIRVEKGRILHPHASWESCLVQPMTAE
jgi:hypothetical protein